MIYATDIFNNELNKGDKVLIQFTYAGATAISIAEISEVLASYVMVTVEMHDIKVPECYANIKNDWAVYHCYKLSKEDWNLGFANFDIYMKNRESDSKSLFEITGRSLKVGDPVLVFNRKGCLDSTQIGIAISDTQVFVGDRVLRNRHVYLLEHLKENELQEYNRLKSIFLMKKQEKLSSSVGLNYNIGDILYNKSEQQVYLYLGKKQIKRYNTEGKELDCKNVYSDGGHCYVKFNLNVLTDKYLYDCLITNTFKEYPYVRPHHFSVNNIRDTIGQQLHSKGFYQGQLLALTVLKNKKDYVCKAGTVDLSCIQDFEVWNFGNNKAPRVSNNHIDFKNHKYIGRKNYFGGNVFSFLTLK